MKSLVVLVVFFLLVACMPPVNSNQETLVTENIGDGISIYHDDIHGATCYIIESQISTVGQIMNGTSYGNQISVIKSISCISDLYLVNVE